MATREGFVIYHEIRNWIELLDDAERGRLLTAMLDYSIEEKDPELSGNERFIWPAVQAKIDRDREAYLAVCERNRQNAAARWNTAANDRMQANAIACDTVPKMPTETITGTKTETETEKETAHARGEFGWVRLTDKQYDKLLQDLGQEELDRCIRYVDEAAQQTGNKNKWKDWVLTIRKCHRDGWGAAPAGKTKQFQTDKDYRARPAAVPTRAQMQSILDRI